MILPAVCLCGAVLAACGGSSHATSASGPAVAQSVCANARAAADPLLGGHVGLEISNPDPTNTECLLSGDGMQLDLVAEANALAWTEFDTTIVHQAQAFGSGNVHVPGQLPHFQRDLGVGVQASWFPARAELVATNGTQSSGGSYVTIDVTGANASGPIGLSVAKAVARATLAVAPRGPSPGPPPS
jgi:hypothetical protein